MNNSSLSAVDETFRSQVAMGVGIIGAISMISSGSIISLILYYKLYKRMHIRYVLYLCMGDFVQALGAACSLGFINHVPQYGEVLCYLQGIALNIGDISSSGMSVFIALFVWVNIHFTQYKWLLFPGRKFECTSVIITWGFSILLICIGWIRFAFQRDPYFTPVGFKSWCWINEEFNVDRVMLLYGWLILFSVIITLIYLHVIITLNSNKGKRLSMTEQKNKKNAFTCCCLVSNGFMNAVLYGYTRRIGQRVGKRGYDDLDDAGSSGVDHPNYSTYFWKESK